MIAFLRRCFARWNWNWMVVVLAIPILALIAALNMGLIRF